MTRPHDMGGRYGDGPVKPEPQDRKFHAAWHKKALAITVAANYLGQWNIDIMRHAREKLAPKDYARFSYYEKWLAALADQLVASGTVTVEELAGATPAPSPIAGKCVSEKNILDRLACGSPAGRPSDDPPRFAPGSVVRTRRIPANQWVDGGHTRLPTYAAGACGRVLRCHGAHVLPDSNAHGRGEAAEPLYTVAFAAAELWAYPEHPRDQVMLDLWESYLEPVT